MVSPGFSLIFFTSGFPGFKNLSKSGPKQSDRARAGSSRKVNIKSFLKPFHAPSLSSETPGLWSKHIFDNFCIFYGTAGSRKKNTALLRLINKYRIDEKLMIPVA
jgi:hypothetical protein